MIEFGNLYYFIPVISLISLITLIYLFLRNKSKKFAFNFILIWCFLGFALHFLKQLVYWNVNDFHKSTAENICAVSTLIFPFIMLSKKKGPFHDFMYCIGVVGGLAGTLWPTEALNNPLFCFESFRFYFCHMSLCSIPILLAALDIYRPKIKRFYWIPLCFLAYESVICLNTGLLIITGLSRPSGMTPIQAFLDHNKMNNSFVFGPTDDMGAIGHFVGCLCPDFMKKDIFNLNNGNITYWPVIWLLIPSFVLFIPLYLIVGLPFFILDSKKKEKI